MVIRPPLVSVHCCVGSPLHESIVTCAPLLNEPSLLVRQSPDAWFATGPGVPMPSVWVLDAEAEAEADALSVAEGDELVVGMLIAFELDDAVAEACVLAEACVEPVPPALAAFEELPFPPSESSAPTTSAATTAATPSPTSAGCSRTNAGSRES